MSEDSIKTAEEQLNALIIESKTVLLKLKKTLNIFLYVAIPIVIMFFISFVDVRSRMSALEVSKLSVVDAEAKYATRSDIVFLQNDIYDLNKSFYVFKQDVTEQKLESGYTKALKEFTGDVTRGAE